MEVVVRLVGALVGVRIGDAAIVERRVIGTVEGSVVGEIDQPAFSLVADAALDQGGRAAVDGLGQEAWPAADAGHARLVVGEGGLFFLMRKIGVGAPRALRGIGESGGQLLAHHLLVKLGQRPLGQRALARLIDAAAVAVPVEGGFRVAQPGAHAVVVALFGRQAEALHAEVLHLQAAVAGAFSPVLQVGVEDAEHAAVLLAGHPVAKAGGAIVVGVAGTQPHLAKPALIALARLAAPAFGLGRFALLQGVIPDCQRLLGRLGRADRQQGEPKC